MNEITYQHTPVLYKEVCELANKPSSYLDGTYGRGGHCKLLIEQCSLSEVYVIDKDPEAILNAEILKKEQDRLNFNIHHGAFHQLDQFLKNNQVDLMLFDLGVSSPQLDDPQRGFSFNQVGPLDMRMDNTRGQSAADLITSLSEEDLANIIYEYGEETQSRKIAKAISTAKLQTKIKDTATLAQIIELAIPRRGKIHPATKTFQALRIAVNQELDHVTQLLESAHKFIKPNGRIIIISFHSLEDRIVKNQFKEWKDKGYGKIITKKCITASDEEIKNNKRARSAKLRCFEVRAA